MINLSVPYLPKKTTYLKYIDRIFETRCLTNKGPLVSELEERLSGFLNVKNVICVANGTFALQVAYKLLGVSNNVITTPFSFIATSSSLLWDGIEPIFVDIDKNTYNLDEKKIIKGDYSPELIVATHVYGNPCQIDYVKNELKSPPKIIYDASHAFGVEVKDDSLFSWGDISVASLHATKIFHTAEGGIICTNDDSIAEEARLRINFGFAGKDKIEALGINGKMHEFSAALGLAILDDMKDIIKKRSIISDIYAEKLSSHFLLQKFHHNSKNNHSWFSILCQNENQRDDIYFKLIKKGILLRRYFFPSLNKVKIFEKHYNCPVSESISSRILCLPIHTELTEKEAVMVADEIIKLA